MVNLNYVTAAGCLSDDYLTSRALWALLRAHPSAVPLKLMALQSRAPDAEQRLAPLVEQHLLPQGGRLPSLFFFCLFVI